ncbi:hypothetical protein [Pseudomonas gorinensis]
MKTLKAYAFGQGVNVCGTTDMIASFPCHHSAHPEASHNRRWLDQQARWMGENA